MNKVAIIGATGPTGISLAAELRKTAAVVRAVSRSMGKLARVFPDATVEKWSADILDADATLLAIEGCDLVYDCIGLPGDQMHLHPVTARNIARALRRTKARCIQLSNYWAYYPQVRLEMDENHLRSGGPAWVRYRREAEDVLCEAGAAILHLPDFYGRHVHLSMLQKALNDAAAGKTINWLGGADVRREYIYIPTRCALLPPLAPAPRPSARIGACPAAARSAASKSRTWPGITSGGRSSCARSG